jgi:hypothetical protein
MTNQEITNLKPLMAAVCVVLLFLCVMLYHYRQLGKSIAATFKGGVIALLVMLGIIDER